MIPICTEGSSTWDLMIRKSGWGSSWDQSTGNACRKCLWPVSRSWLSKEGNIKVFSPTNKSVPHHHCQISQNSHATSPRSPRTQARFSSSSPQSSYQFSFPRPNRPRRDGFQTNTWLPFPWDWWQFRSRLECFPGWGSSLPWGGWKVRLFCTWGRIVCL